MDLWYKSTRDSGMKISASEAILKGLAPDGGLFVPERIPVLDVSLEELKDMSYQETAYAVMKQFLTDFTKEELKDCINKAYDEKFDTEEIAPLAKVGDTYFLELFHGATIAFKDMALSILPHLMTTSAKKNHVKNEIVILTATSGDTGKAAMAGFADVEGTRIIVFYPKNGVSKVQELQMVTQTGSNVNVAAIHGNFDDAQNGVKAIFEDQEFAQELADKGYQLSSANSINIGRLVPQVAYYVYAYAKLLANEEITDKEEIKQHLVLIRSTDQLRNRHAHLLRIICSKDVAEIPGGNCHVDLFRTGTYDRNRAFVLTSSPSMDILISSNLERLIYLAAGEDAELTKELMAGLKDGGSYTVTEEMRAKLADFVPGFASEGDTAACIKRIYDKTGYVLDTHTAVAAHVCEQYRRKSGDSRKCVAASTASPFKFARSVLTAIDSKYEAMDDLALLHELQTVSGVDMPGAVREILDAKVLHTLECDAGQMKETVREVLKI